jgi:hypothetical protein
MARPVTKFIKMGRGIDFYSINGVTHVVRIDMRHNKSFLLGSITGKVDRIGTVDYVNKLKLTENIIPKLRTHFYNFNVNGRTMIPLWVSNGTFFGDDCYESFEVDNPKEKEDMIVAGTIVHKGDPIATSSPTIATPKRRRWGYFQDNNPWPTAITDPGSNIVIARESTPHLASHYAGEGWTSVITGAGSLVENGRVKKREVAQTKAGGNFPIWIKTKGNLHSPTYCAGPMIARNADGNVLYLIQDRTPNNGEKGTNAGRDWGDMARYLRGGFLGHGSLLEDMKCREKDGTIWNAIVYDGGSSRSLWVRGSGIIGGYETNRPVPHYMCLWADVNPR